MGCVKQHLPATKADKPVEACGSRPTASNINLKGIRKMLNNERFRATRCRAQVRTMATRIRG